MWRNGHFKPSIGSHAVVYVARGKRNVTRVYNRTSTCVLMTWHRVLCTSLYVSLGAPHIVLFFLCFCFLPQPLPSFASVSCVFASLLCLCFLCHFLLVILLFSQARGTIRSSSLPDTATKAPQAQEYGSRTKRYFSKTQPYFQSSGFFVHQP